MASMVDFQLTNSRGLGRVIYCHGLETPVIIAPQVQGEPLLTAQAFYYLEELESVARMCTDEIAEEYQTDESHLARRCEYIIDNYLFAYSMKHPESQLSTKVTDFRYWKYDGELYRGYDHNHTKALALDWLNDDTIQSIKNEDYSTQIDWESWCLVSKYSDRAFSDYLQAMQQCIRKFVDIQTEAHEELGSGQFRLPLVLPGPGLLDHNQAMMLDVIGMHDVASGKDKLHVSRGGGSSGKFDLPLESIQTTTWRNSDLLAYYFAGVRERTPIAQFRSFYNVLEFFFESAPIELGESAPTERKQISCVLRLVTDADNIIEFFNHQGSEYQSAVRSEIQTSSGQTISPMRTTPGMVVEDASRWIYEIRCACIHSKATRRGAVSARFVPFSNDENAVALAVPLLQWLAVACIEREST